MCENARKGETPVFIRGFPVCLVIVKSEIGVVIIYVTFEIRVRLGVASNRLICQSG